MVTKGLIINNLSSTFFSLLSFGFTPVGVWVKDGTGIIEQDQDTGMLVWNYEATHFTWWAAGKLQVQNSCGNHGDGVNCVGRLKLCQPHIHRMLESFNLNIDMLVNGECLLKQSINNFLFVQKSNDTTLSKTEMRYRHHFPIQLLPCM